MHISMYDASIPVFARMLNNLIVILNKGQAYCEQRNIDPSVLLTSRLYPDMFPLAQQVRVATDTAKACVGRLSGQDPPIFEDNEVSFPELVTRIERTITYLQGINPDRINGTEATPFVLRRLLGSFSYVGMPYLLHFAVPNFFFHIATAYNILRHCGVEVQKEDFRPYLSGDSEL